VMKALDGHAGSRTLRGQTCPETAPDCKIGAAASPARRHRPLTADRTTEML
jgi:hypothetical protein